MGLNASDTLRNGVLLELSLHIAQSTDVNILLNNVVKKARWMLDFERCALALRNNETNTFNLQILFDSESKDLNHSSTLSFDNSLTGKVIETGESLLFNQREEIMKGFKHFKTLSLEVGGSNIIMCVPVHVSGQTIGVMIFGNQNGQPYTRSEVEAVRVFSTQLGAAILRAQHVEKLEKTVLALSKAKEEIKKNQEELIVISRQAGMAEVATGILHNVGNVLNSVNVSSSIVSRKIRGFKVETFERVLKLMAEHKDNLGDFISNDPKGKKIPELLKQLADHFTEEKTNVLDELNNLERNVEHVKSIIAMQQQHARSGGMSEPGNLHEISDIALEMNLSSLSKHDIQIEKKYGQIPLVILDRHKVLQILVNLITNAGHALRDCNKKEKKIIVETQLGTENDVFLNIIDNGIGISTQNLKRIFEYGFTTKKTGHGFGLHSSATAAQEMGGALFCSSEGQEKGTTFTLKLPTNS